MAFIIYKPNLFLMMWCYIYQSSSITFMLSNQTLTTIHYEIPIWFV